MNEHPSKFVHLTSDVKMWGGPDRSFFVFVMLSIFLGFLGIDHFYLRSYSTAIAKPFLNVLTFGLWYFWDLLQIFSDGERIKKEGLNSPFDWVKGIGRGVFKEPADKGVSEKDYVLYTIATYFGCFGLDKFYLGDYGQGFAKLISCFNIFTFLFGWAWCVYDWFYATFAMKGIMTDGISAPPPISAFFDPIDAKKLFTVKPIVAEVPEQTMTEWVSSALPTLPSLPTLPALPVGELMKLAAPLFEIGKSGAAIASGIQKQGTEVIGGATKALQSATDPGKLAALAALPQGPQIAQGPQIPQGGVPPRGTMVGGGRSEGSGLGPVLAGSLAALLLAGGAKGVYDFIRRQL